MLMVEGSSSTDLRPSSSFTFPVTFLGHSFRKVHVLKPLAEQNLQCLLDILKQTSMTLLWIAECSDFDQSTKRFGATLMFHGETEEIDS